MKNNSYCSRVNRLNLSALLQLLPLLIILTGCATAVDYALLSKTAYEQDQYDDAIINANRSIDKDPNYSYSWLWRGMSQLKKKQYQEAINSLSKAGQLNSDITLQKSITYHIGYAYYQISDCDNAITFYSQNIALGPDWMSYLHRSYCYMDKAMFDEALSDAYHVLQQIESKNDNFKIQAYRVIAFAYLGLGNADESLAIIKQLEADFPLYDAWEDLVAIADITADIPNIKERMTALLHSRGWLGLVSKDYLSNDTRSNDTRGAEISTLVFNNPDIQSELLPGDIVISLNDITITNASDLNRTIKHQKPGYPVLIKALRSINMVQPDNTDINSAKSYTTVFEELDINTTVQPVPASVALEALKDHPFHSVIQEKRKYYQSAEEALSLGQHEKAFELYSASASERWLDSDVVSKTIELYWKIDKQIPASDKAKKDVYFASKTESEIKNIIQLNKTIDMYKSIIQARPWWAEMHYTIAKLYEKRQDYLLAANYLKLYLISATKDNVEVVSSESRFASIQKKIFELEYKALNM